MATDSFNQPFPRHAVVVSEISPDAHLVLDVAALEALETAYGEDYLAVIFNRLDAMNISVLRAVTGHAGRGFEAEEIIGKIGLPEACKRAADAVALAVYGRTVEQEMAHREEQAIAGLERAKKLRAAMEAKNAA